MVKTAVGGGQEHNVGYCHCNLKGMCEDRKKYPTSTFACRFQESNHTLKMEKNCERSAAKVFGHKYEIGDGPVYPNVALSKNTLRIRLKDFQAVIATKMKSDLEKKIAIKMQNPRPQTPIRGPILDLTLIPPSHLLERSLFVR